MPHTLAFDTQGRSQFSFLRIKPCRFTAPNYPSTPALRLFNILELLEVPSEWHRPIDKTGFWSNQLSMRLRKHHYRTGAVMGNIKDTPLSSKSSATLYGFIYCDSQNRFNGTSIHTTQPGPNLLFISKGPN